MTDFPLTGDITSPVVLDYTILGIVSVSYTLTGSILVPVILGTNPMDRRIIVPMVLSAAMRIDARATGGIVAPVVLGGTPRPTARVSDGVVTPVVVSGLLYVGGNPALPVPVVLDAGLRAGSALDAPASIVTPVVMGYSLLGQNFSLTGGTNVPVVLSANFPMGRLVSGGITTPVTLSVAFRTGASVSFPGILPFIRLGGALVASLSEVASEDAEFATTGKRRMLPLIAYAVDARSTADTASVPFGKPFTIAGDFPYTSGLFYESGAAPGFVGFKLGTAAHPVYVFRAPVPNEVLWVAATNSLIRYTVDRQSGKAAWKSYRSWPQRALDGMQVFNSFDPDGVYNYYGTMLGAMMAQLQRDNAIIMDMLNAEKCPQEYLAALATTFDAEFDAADPEITQRVNVLAAIPTARRRGFPDASVLRMRTAGFKSTIFEVWTKLGWPVFSTTRTDVTVSASVPSAIVSIGFSGGPDTLQGIMYFRNNFVPEPTEWVEVKRGVLTKRFYFGALAVDAPGGSVVVTIDTAPNPTNQSFNTMTNLVTAINAWQSSTVVDGIAGEDFRLLPHSYSVTEPVGYWASRYVVIILNKADGSRVVLDDAENTLLRTMLERALPIAARVKSFGTAAPMETEDVGCAESFTVTHV